MREEEEEGEGERAHLMRGFVEVQYFILSLPVARSQQRRERESGKGWKD